MSAGALTHEEARELAAIMNRARKVTVGGDGLSLSCKTPEDALRAFALLQKQGREPVQHGRFKVSTPRSRTGAIAARVGQ